MHQVARLGEQTHQLYDELASAGLDFGITKSGILMVALGREALDTTCSVFASWRTTATSLLSTSWTDPSSGHSNRFCRATSTLVSLVEQESYVDPASVSADVRRGGLRRAGGEIVEGARVTAIEHDHRGVRSVLTTAGRMDAKQLVIAAGAWSPELLASWVSTFPMQPGKGYSFAIRPDVAPARPIHFREAKVVVTPLSGQVRVSGTMELSGHNLRLDERRIRAMEAGARRYIADWPDRPVQEEWVGMRPLAADGLPVLGRVPGVPGAFLATGHSMSGITLAPATGRRWQSSSSRAARPP